MKFILIVLTIIYCSVIIFPGKMNNPAKSVTVPIVLDHNRMLVDAEIQGNDGTWRKVRLWVDSGNPVFFLSEPLARNLGIDLSAAEKSTKKLSSIEASPPGIRIGGMKLGVEGITTKVVFQPYWLFAVMHNDANLPSSILKKYHIVFDYPNRRLTIAEPGILKPRGLASPAKINSKTGIIQLDAVIDKDSLSFALDNGASYSFISEEILTKFANLHPDWPRITGTLGCANMWGWWPSGEQDFQLVRIPGIQWGKDLLQRVGMVGVPKFSPDGPTLGEWYSLKTVTPVDGFLGANAFKAYRVEIDYANSVVYFEKGVEPDRNEMDMVGVSVGLLPDSNYQVIGVVRKDGKIVVEGVEPGDILVSVGDFKTRGATMGTVVDALRGKPGDIRILRLDRNGKSFNLKVRVEHFL